jgi:hypothetical protein
VKSPYFTGLELPGVAGEKKEFHSNYFSQRGEVREPKIYDEES